MEKNKQIESEKFQSFVLAFSMFVMGACAIAYEYSFCKLATDLLGNSSFQWSLIIGLMLLFMGIGSDMQKYFPDEGLVDKFIIIEILLAFAGGFGPILVLYCFGMFPGHFALVQYSFIIIIGFLVGCELPIIIRINERFNQNLKINLSRMLRMDYLGSFFGALFWVFFLVRYLELIEAAFYIALTNILVALLAFVSFKKNLKSRKVISGSIALLIISLSLGVTQAKNWSRNAEQYLYYDPIIYSKTTDFQHVVITEKKSGVFSLYINGNLQFSSVDEHIYHENLVHPVMTIAPSRKRVLILGGGDGLALRELKKYSDIETITLVDLDPVMTEISRDLKIIKELNQSSLEDERIQIIKSLAVSKGDKTRVQKYNERFYHYRQPDQGPEIYIYNVDAGKFIEQIPGLYDVIIIDLPDPNSLDLAKLYSLMFYRNISSKLTPTGIMISQSSSPFFSKEAFLCIGRTMRAAGLNTVPYRHNVPSFGEWGFWIAGNSGFWTAKKIKDRLENISEIGIKSQYLVPDLIRSSLVFGKTWLDSKNRDINTLTNNRLYFYYSQEWSDTYGREE